MSLDGAYDPENVFAKILRGDLPCHQILRDDDAIVFMDLFPQSPGHSLVVPTAAARNLLEIEDAALARLAPTVKRVAQAVRTALEPDGIIVMQFNGAPAGQTVFHLHFHIIPRWDGAEMGAHAAGARADDAELADQAAQIAAALP